MVNPAYVPSGTLLRLKMKSANLCQLWFNNYHPGVQIQRLVAAAVARSWSGFFRPA